MYIEHNGIAWKVERLALIAMVARAFPIGFNANPGTFLLQFDEEANVVEVVKE